MHKLIPRFIIRWLVCSLGLWIAAGLLGNGAISFDSRVRTVVIAGLILAVVNIIIRPIIILASLPAILLTLGLFMVIINGFMVYLASRFYHALHVTNFWAAIFAGMVIGLVNYLVTAILEERNSGV